VIFMMATTELEKIPETVLSRSQVFEFKTISSKQIADHLRKIADAEKLNAEETALLLIARAADGSMRDAQSALDQVIAFAGQKITSEDVSTVLGLVGRDLVLDIVTAVADETPAAAFELAGRAVELGHDLRSVIRELSRVVRDLLVLSVDSSRIDDPEISAETERDRLRALVQRFSREDLLRSFDLLSKVDTDIRTAAQPRYHLEMALLRWIHLRKLVPLTELLSGVATGSAATKGAPVVPPVPRRPGPLDPARGGSTHLREAASTFAPGASTDRSAGKQDPPYVASEGKRDAFLLEIRKAKGAFYNTVVAQAQKIEFGADRVTFSFLPAHRLLREQLEQNRPWLEQIASAVAGRKMPVAAAQLDAAGGQAAPVPVAGTAPQTGPADLKTTVMADSAVQAMLDVFPAEIENIEEIE
jgi:DNA polymerase-3 subunit gamma/tau